MHLQTQVTVGLAVVAALSLTGCGKKEVDPERRAQAQAAKAKEGDWNAERIRLKSLVQSQPNSADARFQLGVRLLTDGEAAPAVTEFERALELKQPEGQVLPYLVDALNQAGRSQEVVTRFGGRSLDDREQSAGLMAGLALAYAQLGNPLMAKKTIETALTQAPKSARALLAQARLHIAFGDLPRAMSTVDDLLQAHPNDAEGWSVKADLLAATPATRADALKAYDKATELRPEFLYALSAGLALRLVQSDVEGARKDLARLQKFAPRHVNTGMSEAAIAHATGEYDKARDLYQALLRALPEDISVLLAAGENELKLDAFQQAEAYFAKASSMAPRNLRARRLLADAQMKLGQPARALVTLAPLVDAREAPADVLALAAEASLQNGDQRAADALFKRLATVKPDDPQVRTLIARAKLGKSQDEGALGELRTIAAADSGVSADLALVTAHLQRNQFDQALVAVDGLVKKRPKDPASHNLRGKVLAGKGDRAEARSAFEAALALNKTYYPSVASLALLDMQDQKFDAARQRFTDLLKVQPKNIAGLLGLAEVQARLGAPREEVRKLLEQAVKEVPGDVDARVALISHHMGANNNEAALAAAQQATAAVPDNMALLDLLGRCQIAARQGAQALTTYGKIVSLQPKSPRGHMGMVDAYLAQDQPELARKSLERALEIAPHDVDVLGRGIAVAARQRQFPEAIAFARRIQADRPGESIGFLAEGEIEMSRGNWDTAATALRKGLERPLPGGASAKLYHSLVRAGKAGEAEKFAQEWLKAQPRDTSLMFYLADEAQRKGDLPGAEQRYGQLLAVNGNHALALNNLAMLKIKQKKPGALPLAQKAVENMPDQPALLDTLAQAYAADNKLDKAIETQQRALVLAPQEGMVRLALARYLLADGSKALAKGELDKLAALGTGFAGHAEVQSMLGSLTSLVSGR